MHAERTGGTYVTPRLAKVREEEAASGPASPLFTSVFTLLSCRDVFLFSAAGGEGGREGKSKKSDRETKQQKTVFHKAKLNQRGLLPLSSIHRHRHRGRERQRERHRRERKKRRNAEPKAVLGEMERQGGEEEWEEERGGTRVREKQQRHTGLCARQKRKSEKGKLRSGKRERGDDPWGCFPRRSSQ